MCMYSSWCLLTVPARTSSKTADLWHAVQGGWRGQSSKPELLKMFAPEKASSSVYPFSKARMYLTIAVPCRGDGGGQSSMQDLLQMFAPEEASSSVSTSTQAPVYRDPDDPMDAFGPKRPNAPQVRLLPRGFCLPTAL